MVRKVVRGRRCVAIGLSLALGISLGCATPKGATVSDQRSAARAMRTAALADFERAHPGVSARAARAPGHAVFSNVNVQILLAGGGQGYGVARSSSGRETFMKMAQVGVGVGLGAKDFRVLFLFRDEISFKRFVAEGWEFGVDADAALISSGDRGAQAGASGRVGSAGASAGASATGAVGSADASAAEAAGSGVEIYQITESGFALKAMVAGTRYWKDGALN